MKSIILFLLLSATLYLHAEPELIKVWPNGLPADAKPLSGEKVRSLTAKNVPGNRIYYTEEVTLTRYPVPDDKANGSVVVVCPGGGYNILAWDHEGDEIARWLNSFGVTAAVLTYRVPRRDPDRYWHEPLQDVQRAIRVVRHHAADWGLDPDRLGVLGFSAGGNLTVRAGLQSGLKAYPAKDLIDKLNCKPNFIMPIYCAYLGHPDDKGRLREDLKVTGDSPPLFAAVTLDDKDRGLHTALLIAEYGEAQVPAEAHIYSKGGHGYGIRPSDKPVSTWHRRAEEWMKFSGWLDR
jgi:acetyl esterase/lipase